MQSLFLTHSQLVSPRWQQAFPDAVVSEAGAQGVLCQDKLIWVVLDDDLTLLEPLPAWLSANARVIGLTAAENVQQARQVLERGAHGYLHYLAAAPVLTQVAQVVSVGGLWLGADLMRQLVLGTTHLLNTVSPVDRLVKPSSPLLELLTQREAAVAEAVAAGKSNKEVARDLAITERTVKAHLSAVFEKLNVRDRLQLVLVMSEQSR